MSCMTLKESPKFIFQTRNKLVATLLEIGLPPSLLATLLVNFEAIKTQDDMVHLRCFLFFTTTMHPRNISNSHSLCKRKGPLWIFWVFFFVFFCFVFFVFFWGGGVVVLFISLNRRGCTLSAANKGYRTGVSLDTAVCLSCQLMLKALTLLAHSYNIQHSGGEFQHKYPVYNCSPHQHTKSNRSIKHIRSIVNTNRKGAQIYNS